MCHQYFPSLFQIEMRMLKKGFQQICMLFVETLFPLKPRAYSLFREPCMREIPDDSIEFRFVWIQNLTVVRQIIHINLMMDLYSIAFEPLNIVFNI